MEYAGLITNSGWWKFFLTIMQHIWHNVLLSQTVSDTKRVELTGFVKKWKHALFLIHIAIYLDVPSLISVWVFISAKEPWSCKSSTMNSRIELDNSQTENLNWIIIGGPKHTSHTP